MNLRQPTAAPYWPASSAVSGRYGGDGYLREHQQQLNNVQVLAVDHGVERPLLATEDGLERRERRIDGLAERLHNEQVVGGGLESLATRAESASPTRH